MTHRDPHYVPPVHEEPDPWHRHLPEQEGLPQHEHGARANPVLLALVFTVSVISVVALVAAVAIYTRRHFVTVRQEQLETTVLAEQALAERLKWEQLLEQGGWLDAETVQAPIEVAMEQVIEQYRVGGEQADAD